MNHLNTGIQSIFLFLVAVSFFYACNTKTNTDPDNYLSATEQEEFKYSIIRYAGKLARKATESTKFESTYDMYYKNLAANHELISYYPDEKSGNTYFMLYRVAPSLHFKKVALAGKMKFDDNQSITHYEEIFRTYKMSEADLSLKASKLFQVLIAGKDLEKYQYKNTQPEEWIEFPNENTWYDPEKRLWKSALEDPLLEYHNIKD